ncbi:MAG TPA: hypothetical protein VGC99_15745, partial [Candidatus Tectomicrobia bacterium]
MGCRCCGFRCRGVQSFMVRVASSLVLFLLAGLCEIGGGYLIWQWWRNGAHWGVGTLGALALCL